MFIGAGIGKGWDDPHGVERFYQGYGSGGVDPIGVAYYRYERIVEDVAAYCQEIRIWSVAKPGPPPGAELTYLSEPIPPKRRHRHRLPHDQTNLSTDDRPLTSDTTRSSAFLRQYSRLFDSLPPSYGAFMPRR